jgi:hypothetical protein
VLLDPPQAVNITATQNTDSTRTNDMETPDGTQIGSGYAAADALAALTLINGSVSAKYVRIARCSVG